MKNLSVEIKDATLVMTVDLTKEVGLSKSRKSAIISTSEGDVLVPGLESVKMAVNVYRPSRKGEIV